MDESSGPRRSFTWNFNSMTIRKEERDMKPRDKESLRKEIMEALGERTGPRQIFLVEDDPEIREALRFLLEKEYRVVGVSSGEKLLELLDGYEPSLVILDVNLPGRDGFELCRMIRSSRRHRYLPVMFLTVRRDDDTFLKSIEGNADAFLNKPFEKKELKDTIERLIGAGQAGA